MLHQVYQRVVIFFFQLYQVSKAVSHLAIYPACLSYKFPYIILRQNYFCWIFELQQEKIPKSFNLLLISFLSLSPWLRSKISLKKTKRTKVIKYFNVFIGTEYIIDNDMLIVINTKTERRFRLCGYYCPLKQFIKDKWNWNWKKSNKIEAKKYRSRINNFEYCSDLHVSS